MSSQTTSAQEKSAKNNIDHPRIVSPEQWLAERKQLLVKEKEETRLRDQLSAERRKLPWERVEKQYVFDGPEGKETLADLFGQNSQLIVYHFMFGPDWEEGCPSCSFLADHIGGTLAHLNARDISLVVVSRAPLAKIEAFKKRMGWQFKWVSSYENDFNFDYHVSFTKDEQATGDVYYNYALRQFPSDEAPGNSVFYKNGSGEVFHTYSAYARGCDILLGAYNFLDFAPKGRDEDGLDFTMSWVRHHDKYEDNAVAKPIGIERKPVVNLEPPRFENAGPMFITGPSKTYTLANIGGISEQWQSFAPYIGKVTGQIGQAAYGVPSHMCTPGGSFQVLTGVEVADLSGIPDEFSGVRLPAQQYAVFNHREHVSTIINTIGAIFDTWLPGSGYEAVSSPPFLERYGENFNPTTLTGGIEIWLPIKA